MAQIGQVQILRTVAASEFREAAAAGVMLGLDKSVAEIAGGLTVRYRLKAIIIQSKENLAWMLWLFSKAIALQLTTTDPDVAKLLGFWKFAVADEEQRDGSTGLYYYYIDGLDVPVVDDDGTTKLHLGLVSRSGNKSAGDAGAVSVGLVLEECNGL